MDSRTVALIRTTFKAIAAEESGPEQLARSFYAILFAEHPHLRDLFPAALEIQRDRLVKAIAYTVDRLEEPELLLPFLAQLGRDHRKYGVTAGHYVAVGESLKKALESFSGTEIWTDEAGRAWDECIGMISNVMVEAAEAETTPPVWTGTVVEHRQVLRNLAIVRLKLDQPMEYTAGRYVSVQIPSRPRMWRYLSPAVPANADGELEFHIRGVSGGWVSPSMVANTRAGEQWLLGSPLGDLGVPADAGRALLMVACGTGIAPMRAQLLAMSGRSGNPRVDLFVGGHHPCDLYDLEVLSRLACDNEWLTVTPVVESEENPWWHLDSDTPAPDYPGLRPRLVGPLGKTVAAAGDWSAHDIQLAGAPATVQTMKFRLMAAGVPTESIRHDPLF